MKNISIWKDTVKLTNYKELSEDKNVDILIIGGGMTGVSTLYHLRNSNLKVILVEQNKIGNSVTGNSTGKLNYLQNDLIDKIRTSFNDSIASIYLRSQMSAIDMIVDIIKKENIDCDLQKLDAYLYTNKQKEVLKIKKLEKFLNSNNIKTKKGNIDLVKSKYMIKVSDTYEFNPIKFLYGLLKSNTYPIYENTSIIKIKKESNYYSCYTDKHKIKAKTVVIASHYPYFIIPYFFPIKVSLEKSYLSASLYNLKPLSLISYSNPFISIRDYKAHLIYLSNSHSVNSQVCDKKNFQEHLKKLKDLKLKPDYLWSNIDVISNDGLPYIGNIKDNLLIGTGYNTWGLTNGFLAGKILSDIILNKSNEYIKLFGPKRENLAQIIGGVEDAFKTLSGYFNGYFNKNKNITYKTINNKPVMIYKDINKEYVVRKKCPHAGCDLIFNEIEKTWDCPCHGSRFDISGKCISGPSNKNITIT